ANSVRVSGTRSFISNASSTPSSVTFSYTHRFGAGSGGGLQFSHLLGLDRGSIQGRAFLDLNGNGKDDADEPGIVGMKVQVDAKHVAVTDGQGRFNFSNIDADEQKVVLVSDDLGTRLRATTPTEQVVYVEAHRTNKIAFGLTNSGSISGRIFSDLSRRDDQRALNAPGISGVTIKVHLADESVKGPVLSQTVDASGEYSFRDLPPGTYKVELDLMSLPADFRLPEQSSWTVTVEPLKGTYLDIPISAERAIAGVVFRDKDNDGQFDPQKDEAIEGARVVAGDVETLTDRNGAYILRNLPAGKIEVRATQPSGGESRLVMIVLGAEPSTHRAINLSIADGRRIAVRK
ncbi:MAG TPA: SdrD B-like domain-containing protein, partial [Pyrinomonadaceae bacterium]